jgi:Lar family restriction alleviation protein
MTEQTRPALLPCPFCGGNNLHVGLDDIDGWMAHVACRDCDDMAGPISRYKYADKDEAVEDASTLWNRRASLSPAQPVSDERIREIAEAWNVTERPITIANCVRAIRQALRESPVAQAEPVAIVVDHQDADFDDMRIAFIKKDINANLSSGDKLYTAPPSHAQGVASGIALAASLSPNGANVSGADAPHIVWQKYSAAIRALQPQDVVCGVHEESWNESTARVPIALVDALSNWSGAEPSQSVLAREVDRWLAAAQKGE